MVLAQLLFAGMNICTRLGSTRVPWPEVASARFLIGALLAGGVAAARGTSLQIIDQPGAWRRSIFGALAPEDRPGGKPRGRGAALFPGGLRHHGPAGPAAVEVAGRPQ
jgi:hypothetical protein